MRYEVKIDRFGDAVGFILPEALVQDLGLHEGDSLVLSPKTGGDVDVSKAGPDFSEKMRIAGECMDRYANAFRKLADS